METPETAISRGSTREGQAEILVEGLYKSFGDNHALSGVDLKIPRNSMVAIVGDSGCGKTVLLNHILGLMTPDRGSVQVADHDRTGSPLVDVAALDDRQLDKIHQHWGVVFQNNALFSGSVIDNIALWLSEVKNMEPESIRPIARTVLDAVHLPTTDEFLGLEVQGLSGGMAKRLAVARALAMEPLVTFYDEPTTGLDPTSAAQIHDLIVASHDAFRAAGSDHTSIIITHDKDLLARLRPRTIMLHQGRVFFDGALADFEKSSLPHVRPYFDIMPALHRGAERTA